MTSIETIEVALADLGAGEKRWAGTSLAQRAELLRRVHASVAGQAENWVRAACGVKRLDPDGPLAGEEWLTGPFAVLSALTALAGSLDALDGGGSPADGYRFGRGPGGRVTVEVLPHARYDRLLLSGFSAEVWIEPGVTEQVVRGRAGLAQRNPGEVNGIGVVLGAGNVTSIPVLDVLSELIAHNRVVALKLNPVTDPMAEVFEAALEPLISTGVLRILTGGAGTGQRLVRHPQVGHVHLTGSAATHDAIIWGTGPDAAGRRRSGVPLLDTPVTSELGGVSPVIVLPGHWSAADLRFQAEHVVSQRLHNGGCNCIASQVLVVSASWPQKDRFLDEVRRVLETAPARPAWYPGSDDRLARAQASYPDAERHGERLLLPSVDPASPAASTEYFAPVLGVIELPGRGFLTGAVRLANERLAGTLGANVIAHPRTMRMLGADFGAAIAALRYGTIAINAWTGVGFATPAATWGAFAGHTLSDAGSGIGQVHNAALLPCAERTVVRGPFRPAPRSLLTGQPSLSPRPPWFVTARTAARTGRLMTGLAARPRRSALPAIIASAMRG